MKGFDAMSVDRYRGARNRVDLIGVPIDSLSWDQALDSIESWGRARESRVVAICNVHSLVTARRDQHFFSVIKNADLATPDGAPLAFLLRRRGFSGQQRINGPDLMWRHCRRAEGSGSSIFLFGGTKDALALLKVQLKNEFPQLNVVGAYSPPFRELTEEEDRAVVDMINESGAEVVWVGLGCPKQEIWMENHRGRVSAVMVGVGAAFDYHAGIIVRAPEFIQRIGLEWFYRLCSEPRRLWKRYLITNSLFGLYLLKDMVGLGRK